MLVELGKELKRARNKAGVSLEAVAGPAKISAAYLHKLEHGSVNNPSPRVLARLAVVVDLPYLRLLELAGYLDEEQYAQVLIREPSVDPHPLAGQRLSSEEWQAVSAYIKLLVSERKP